MNAAEQQAFDKMREALEWIKNCSSFSGQYVRSSVNKKAIEALSAAKAVQTAKWSGDPSTQDYASTQPDTGAVMPNGEVVSNVYEAFEAGKKAVQPAQIQPDFTSQHRADARTAIQSGGWAEAIKKCLPVAECFIGSDSEVMNPAPLSTLIAGDGRTIAPLFVAAQPVQPQARRPSNAV